MSEPIEALLSELVVLARAQLANQQQSLENQVRAMENQRRAMENQANAVARSRRSQAFAIALLIAIMGAVFVAPILNWLVRRGG